MKWLISSLLCITITIVIVSCIQASGIIQKCPSLDSNSSYVNANYEYDNEMTVKIPFLKHLNPADMPSPEWFRKLSQQTNNSIITSFGFTPTTAREIQTLPEISRIEHLLDYVAMMIDGPIEPGFEIDRPWKEYVVSTTADLDETNSTVRDDAFCSYRLSGPNPGVIRLCTSEHLAKLGFDEDPDMQLLMRQNSLFVVDFSFFAKFPAGGSYLDAPPKHVYGTIALFMLDDMLGRNLKPICIQVIGSSGDKRLYFPEDGLHWKIAKMIFQMNDADHQQFFSHLSGTHLVMESFLVATYRRLPTDHPLYVLLVKHFEGTASVNSGVLPTLIQNTSSLNGMVSPDMTAHVDLLPQYIIGILSKDFSFPTRIKARGMHKVPTLDYPYRDDGMLVWDAILKWTRNYLKSFYRSHKEVLDDKDLCAWLCELESDEGGMVKWINSLPFDKYNARDALTIFVASIIFHGSAEHAAMNFRIRSSLQFTGAFPFSVHGGEDVTFKDDPTEEDYIRLFPTLRMSHSAAELSSFFSTMRYTRLGYYDPIPVNGTAPPVGQYFSDNVDAKYRDRFPEVSRSLRNFHRDLDLIIEKINKRNTEREFKYVEMYPAGMPMSINI